MSNCFPRINGRLRPRRHRHGSHLVAFADNIDNRPASFALLDMRKRKNRGFRATQSAADQHRQQRAVTHTFQSFHVRSVEPSLRIFFRQPVAGAPAAKRHAFDGANSIGNPESIKLLSSDFSREFSDRGKFLIDGRRREFPRTQSFHIAIDQSLI